MKKSMVVDSRTKIYPLAREVKFLYFFILLGASFFVVTGEPVHGSLIETYVLFALSLVLGLFGTYKIEVHADGVIIFRKIIGTVKITADQIVSIACRTRNEIINCQKIHILLSPSISNLKDLKATLTALNPKIQLLDDPKFFPKDTWGQLRFLLTMNLIVILYGIALYILVSKFIARSF